jgi:hypothetical protein
MRKSTITYLVFFNTRLLASTKHTVRRPALLGAPKGAPRCKRTKDVDNKGSAFLGAICELCHNEAAGNSVLSSPEQRPSSLTTASCLLDPEIRKNGGNQHETAVLEIRAPLKKLTGLFGESGECHLAN